jgi:hypothetical protein
MKVQLFNGVQAVVLSDIVRFWKDSKHGDGTPCIFLVDCRGSSFHVQYDDREDRDYDFDQLLKSMTNA